jgi:hypothetical protein
MSSGFHGHDVTSLRQVVLRRNRRSRKSIFRAIRKTNQRGTVRGDSAGFNRREVSDFRAHAATFTRGRKRQGCSEIFAGKLREVLPDFVFGHYSGKVFQNIVHRDPRALGSRPPLRTVGLMEIRSRHDV